MRRLPAGVAALAVALASCGGGGDGASPATSTVPATTSPPGPSASSTATTDGTGVTTAAEPTTTAVATTAASPSTTVATSSTATGPTTSISPAPSTTTGGAAPAGLPVGTPVRLAEGDLTAVSPDGSHVIVRDVVEGLSERGCEGELEPVMLRVPTDGGDPLPMFADGDQYNGNLEPLADGRAVLLAGCEEFLTQIVVFAWSPVGALSEPTVVPRFSGDTIENLLGVAWAEGNVLYGLGTTFTFDGLDTRIVSIDATTGEVTDVLPADQAIVVGRLADGTMAIGDGETVRIVPLTGGPATLTVPGEWLAVSPDGTTVAVVGPGIVLHRPATEPESLPVEAPGDAPVIDVSWSPDGRHVAYIARGVDDTVGVVEIGTGATAIDTARRVFGLTWSEDGSVLGYTRIQEETGAELGDLEAMAVRITPAP